MMMQRLARAPLRSLVSNPPTLLVGVASRISGLRTFETSSSPCLGGAQPAAFFSQDRPTRTPDIEKYLSLRRSPFSPMSLQPLRAFSTDSSQASRPSPAPSSTTSPSSPPPKLDFFDSRLAFETKTTWELVRALLVFRMCSIQWLVRTSEKLITVSRAVLGDTIPFLFIRPTFFEHFTAGNEQDLPFVLQRLQKIGVGAILDYAAEKDVSTPSETDSGIDLLEKECDENMEIILQGIKIASASPLGGVMAIKITGLGKPVVLQSISDYLLGVRRLWSSHFQPDRNKGIDKQLFSQAFEKMGIHHTPEKMDKLFSDFDKDKNGEINYIDWTESLNITDHEILFDSKIAQTGLIKVPTAEEYKAIESALRRAYRIADEAEKLNVKLLVDAEQTYMQLAIDHLTHVLQKKKNHTKPLIFNTYQCYLTYSKLRIQNDLERSLRHGIFFAGKLVRGAYMIQERKRAKELNLPSPIWPTIEDTHANYDECVELVMKNIDRSSLIIASHNLPSTERAINKMHELGIPANTDRVSFGQLLGMSDHLSLTLSRNGYRVFKYVPYGPIGEVIPYLVRRAQENSDIMSNVGAEREMLWQELKRRLMGRN
eukprot:TRINITY_DN3625_c1_g1_i1.p1 TRINITY_DN3625_c1_g1~~TRINITY_DN3625_c1_g1_i1.p1  ORF type:complete len:655 (+),score=205.23 TRINITY_DN3625_c1_g1_i1:174-1967(+)